jgi:hypothetical protein
VMDYPPPILALPNFVTSLSAQQRTVATTSRICRTRTPARHTYRPHKHATANKTRSESLGVGDYRLPLRVRTMLARQPIRSDAQGRLWSRVQDLHTSIHHLSMEGRPHRPPEAHKHLPHMCAPEELLPVLHARSVLRSTHRRS